MRLPARLDRFVENGLLGRLDRRRLKLLHALLGVGAAAGVWLSWRHPEISALALLFPCVVLVFFGASLAGGLGWIALFACLRPHPLEIAAFAGSVAVGSLFAQITADRYRQSRSRELELQKAFELARRRQQQLEPAARQVLHGRLEVSTWMQVCRGLGGDFLVVEELPGERVSLILGDVLGKGLPAALVAAYLEGVYRYLARSGLEPAAVLTELNRSLAGFDPEDTLFATAICLEADLKRGLWLVSRAGHEIPSRPDFAGPPHLPLGLDMDLLYTQIEIPMGDADMVLLASDGVTDLLGPLEELALEGGLAPLAAGLDEDLQDDATLALLRGLSKS